MLSVLDQSPVPAGSTPAEALAHTLDLARAADAQGYSRYWLAEHHGTTGLAGTAPEVLAARVAAATSRIRVGAGGVLLSHYSPLKVAECFRTLHALFPGRIDLGVGRAAGADARTAAALQAGREAPDEEFPHRVADLVALLGEGLPDDHPWAGVRAVPQAPGGPQVWMLGSSPHSAAYAASLGLPFCFAHFITPAYGPQVAGRYRARFQPSAALAQPRTAVAVAVVCADTDAEAERLATSLLVWRLADEHERGPVPSVEEAQGVVATGLQRARMAQDRARLVVGGPERARHELDALARSFGADEVVVLTVCHDPAARLRSYALLAGAFDLAGAGQRAGGGW